MLTKAAALARNKALSNCAQDCHQWHPTFVLGEKLCTVCGERAYCPYCLGRLFHGTARLMICALHLTSDQRKEAQL